MCLSLSFPLTLTLGRASCGLTYVWKLSTPTMAESTARHEEERGDRGTSRHRPLSAFSVIGWLSTPANQQVQTQPRSPDPIRMFQRNESPLTSTLPSVPSHQGVQPHPRLGRFQGSQGLAGQVRSTSMTEGAEGGWVDNSPSSPSFYSVLLLRYASSATRLGYAKSATLAGLI